MSLRRLTERKFCLDWREGRHSWEQQPLEEIVYSEVYSNFSINYKHASCPSTCQSLLADCRHRLFRYAVGKCMQVHINIR